MFVLKKGRKDIPKTFYVTKAELSIFEFGANIGILRMGSSCVGIIRPSTLLSGSTIAVLVFFPISPNKIPSVTSGVRGNCFVNVCELCGIYKYLVRVKRELWASDVAF